MESTDDGSALYVIQMDIDIALEDEFERWNGEEHLAERLSCPGFLTASRYRLDPHGRPGKPDATPPARHLTIYELADRNALLSEEYAQRTAAPTEWTKRIASNLQVRSRGVYVRTQLVKSS